MLYTEENVRAGIRNQNGKRIFPLAQSDRLTPSARDWLHNENIEIVAPQSAVSYTTPFGGEFKTKPEELTHLHGTVLVPKTHPRIAFRGMVDALEAEILLCQCICDDALTAPLQEMLDFTRTLIRADVLGEPVKQTTLCSLNEEELREHSHHPEKYYGQPHFLPHYKDGRTILQLNRLRTLVRQTELACCRAFTDSCGKCIRPDIVRALNRLSSLCWILMIRCKAGYK